MKACNDKMRTRRHFFTRAMTKRQEEEQRFDIYDLVTFLDKKRHVSLAWHNDRDPSMARADHGGS